MHVTRDGVLLRLRRVPYWVVFALGSLNHIPHAWAANGLNLIGFGGESALMAGADVALARDTTALNTNPAGITQIRQCAIDLLGGFATDLDIAHADQFGNDRGVSNHVIPGVGGGYARRVEGTDVTIGVGFFGQGGAGNVYEDLNTAFGTRDELSGLFRIARLSPGLAWQVNDAFSLGASLILNVADLNQKVFPDTSFFNAAAPSQSFFGFEVEKARAAAAGIKIGMQYRLTESLTFGAAYSNKTRLTLKNGRLHANFSAIGLDTVTYRDTRIEGLALPHDVAIGLAYRPTPKWLVAWELNWLNWKDALKTSRLIATDPDNPAAPPTFESTVPLNWRDQYVIIVGAEYEISAATKLRGGYNYGKNPIPAETTNPLLANIGEHHLTFGIVHKLSNAWEFAAGVEYLFPIQVTYTNPSLPFGTNTQERNSYIALHFMVSRRW